MLNALLEKHPITPRIADHDLADLHIHVANKAASVADLLIGESLLGLANLVCDLGPTRLGVCAATRAPTSTSTPPPTSRAATAPSAAPRGPTSRPSGPARRPPRAEAVVEFPAQAGNSALRGEISANK